MSISINFFLKLIPIVFLCFCIQANALEFEGIKIDDVVQVGPTTLHLNGDGLRKKFIFKVYVGALYLIEKKHTASAILADAGQKRLAMHLLRDLSSEQLQDAFEKGLSANNTPEELVVMNSSIQEFLAIFRLKSEIAKGSLVLLDFFSGEGVRVSINGEEKGRVVGAEFSRALLKIWLGDNPADEDLKQGLIGG